MFKVELFKEERIGDLVELKRLCEIESGWSPPAEYLAEWAKVVVGLHNHDPNLVKIALTDRRIVGYCISVKRLHNYEVLSWISPGIQPTYGTFMF